MKFQDSLYPGVKVNDGNKSDCMKKTEKQSITKVMNLF